MHKVPRLGQVMKDYPPISCNKPNFVPAITRQTLPSTVVNVARERKEESHFLNGVIQGSPALITSAAAALGQQGNGTRLQIPSFSQRWNQLFFAANISTAFPPAYVSCFDFFFWPRGIRHFNGSQSQIPHPQAPTKCQFPASGVTFSNRVRT